MTADTAAALPFRIKSSLHRTSTQDLLDQIKSGAFTKPALILEGRGGMGKTFFLNQLGSILERADAQPRKPGAPMLIGAIDASSSPMRVLPLDMIFADVALPRTFEQILLTCVDRSPYAPHDFFRDYKARREEYQRLRQHLSFADLASRERELRERFFDGWERLAAASRARLVISFDTCEYLERTRISELTKIADSSDVGEHGLGVRNQFFAWISEALGLRRLKQTLFVFCGRGVAGGELSRVLDTATGHSVEVIDLEGLDDPAVGAYLQPVAGDIPPDELAQLGQTLTGGSPLKLDLLYELLAREPGWCRRELFGPDIAPGDARLRFYTTALRRFFDPANYLDDESISPAAQACGLSLVCLAYARCGASLDDLLSFIAEEYGLLDLSAAELRTYLEGDDTTSGHALVKKLSPRAEDDRSGAADPRIRRQPQYFLHDQLWVDIESLFRQTGVGQVVWRFLEARRMAAIAACDTDERWHRRVELMCEHLIVAMLRDPVESYRYYTLYIDQALRLRDADAAVVLSETFWRTVYYETSSDQGRYFPVLSSLVGSRAISLEAIARDEQVRQLRLLAALSRPAREPERAPGDDDERNQAALDRARTIERSLRRDLQAAPDSYLKTTLTLGMIDVLLIYDPYDPDLRTYLKDLVDDLNAEIDRPDGEPDRFWRNARRPLLKRRLQLLIARAYRYRAELNESLRHFKDARDYADKSIAALERYAEEDGAAIDIAVTRERALAEVCRANSLTRLGLRSEAKAVFEQFRSLLMPPDGTAHRLSPHDRVLLLARCAIAFPDERFSDGYSRTALELARTIGVKRTLDSAYLARLTYLRRQSTLGRTSATYATEQAERDREIDTLIAYLAPGDRPAVAPDLGYDTINEIARALRSRFSHRSDPPEREAAPLPRIDVSLLPLQRAYSLIVTSDIEQRLREAVDGDHRDQWYRRVQYADLIETKVSSYSALLMALHHKAQLRGEPYADQETIERHLTRVGKPAHDPELPPIRTVDDLQQLLDAIEGHLLANLNDQREGYRHTDPFILVVLGKIAIQRGLLLHYGRPGAGRGSAVVAQLTLALAFAARFSAEPNRLHERDIFRWLTQRVLVGDQHRDDAIGPDAAELGRASGPPGILLLRPDIGLGDDPARAWQSACDQVRDILA